MLSVEFGIEEPLATLLDSHEEYERDNSARYVREELQFGRACLALIRGDAPEARKLLEPLARNSILLRRHRALGRTYEALGLWARAAAEYETVVQNPYDKWWIYDNPAIFVLDQFRLAQVYKQLGDTDRARHWYERFLDDWKDADPDIPEVIEAQARLAAIRSDP